jgi:hypothetical protein
VAPLLHARYLQRLEEAMKRLILRLMLAILAFNCGLLAHRKFGSPKPVEVQSSQVCVPDRVEVRTVFVPPPAPPPPSPHGVFDFDVREFDPMGYFHVVGKKPKGLEQLNNFYLSWAYDNLAVTETVRADFYDNKKYSAAFVSVTRRRVVFVTKPESVDTFAYRFDGEFLHTNLVPFVNSSKPVLRGTLSKWKGNKKIAEGVVSFRLEQHIGC